MNENEKNELLNHLKSIEFFINSIQVGPNWDVQSTCGFLSSSSEEKIKWYKANNDRLYEECIKAEREAIRLECELSQQKSANSFLQRDLATERNLIQELIAQRNSLSLSNKKLQQNIDQVKEEYGTQDSE